MTQLSCDLITLGADVGGKDAFNATNQHILALRNLLRKIDASTANGALKEIALVLRVDGSVQAWGKRGVDNISFQKKKSFVTVDIFVPTDIWQAGDPTRIRNFLLDQVRLAVRLVLDYVNQHGVILNGPNLNEALEKAVQQYLN